MTEKYSRTHKACYMCDHITYMGDPDECQKCGHETYKLVPLEKMTERHYMKAIKRCSTCGFLVHSLNEKCTNCNGKKFRSITVEEFVAVKSVETAKRNGMFFSDLPPQKMTRKLHFKRHWRNFAYKMGNIWDNITDWFGDVFYYHPRNFFHRRRDKFRYYLQEKKDFIPKWDLFTPLSHIRERIYIDNTNFNLYKRVRFFKSYYKLFHKTDKPEEVTL